jgi:hypothetical protein
MAEGPLTMGNAKIKALDSSLVNDFICTAFVRLTDMPSDGDRPPCHERYR